MGVSSYFSGRKIIVYIIVAFVAWFAWLDNIIDYLFFIGLYAENWPYYDIFTFPDFAYNVTLALPLIVFVMTLLPEAEKWKNYQVSKSRWASSSLCMAQGRIAVNQ